MSSCEIPCGNYYITTGVVVPMIWLITALILWILRNKNIVCGTKDSSNSCEMIPVKNEEKEDTVVYHQIAFSNGNRKPRERNTEDEVTYAQVKISSQQNDEIIYTDVKCNKTKNKENDAPKDSDAQITYAAIKPKSKEPKAQGGNQDLYAGVVKKNAGNTKEA